MRRFASLVTAAPFLALFLAVAGEAQAQDASAVLGSWEVTMETPRGEITQLLTFVQSDDGLSGTVSTPRGETALQNVAFSEGVLTFAVVRQMRGDTMTQTFSATVAGHEMTGTISGGRGGGRAFAASRK
ncbi:MAG: hypothetical protein ACR2QM_09225 [Longimicrobiales bacterium]